MQGKQQNQNRAFWAFLFVAFVSALAVVIAALIVNTDQQQPTFTPTPNILIVGSTSELVSDSRVIYQTTFDDAMNWLQHGNTDLQNNLLTVEGKSSGAGHSATLSTGNGFLVLFRYSSGTSANIVLFSVSNDRYIGIQIPTTRDFTVSLGYGGEWMGGQSLNGNLSFATNHWYYGLVEIRDGGQFYLKIWDKDNSNDYREKLLPMGSQWDNLSWNPSITTNEFNEGRIEVAYYEEFLFNNR